MGRKYASKYTTLKGFPLKNDTKIPIVSNWSALPSYKKLHEFPNKNKAVLCGKENGLLVVDCDVKKNNGIASFDNLMRELGVDDYQDTLMVSTPSGGIHYYYRLPDEYLEMRKQPRDDMGIDFQMEGSYVVAVGSYNADYEHEGQYAGTYDVANNRPIAPVPPALMQWLVENKRDDVDFVKGKLNRSMRVFCGLVDYDLKNTLVSEGACHRMVKTLRRHCTSEQWDIEQVVEMLRSYVGATEQAFYPTFKTQRPEYSTSLDVFINDLLRVRYEEGGRNNALARMCGRLALGTNKFETYEFLARFWMDSCFAEPLEENEIELTLRSIWRREKGERK